MSDLRECSEFGVRSDDQVGSAFRSLYRTQAGDALSAAAEEAFDAVRLLENIDPDRQNLPTRVREAGQTERSGLVPYQFLRIQISAPPSR